MIRYFVVYCWIVIIFFVCVCHSTTKLPEHTAKNHELLSKLGLSRVRAPNSHHRKRLAIESRHHSRSDDSHMFVVKLPPNPYYYVHNKPNSFDDSSKKIPVGFKSNGKPDKIYHWNIPVIKKYKSIKSKSRASDSDADVTNILNSQMWNEVVEKPGHFRKNSHKPSYYIPARPKKSSVMKYFPGNGKPKSFYVIEKSKKAHYHRLLP